MKKGTKKPKNKSTKRNLRRNFLRQHAPGGNEMTAGIICAIVVWAIQMAMFFFNEGPPESIGDFFVTAIIAGVIAAGIGGALAGLTATGMTK
jgi:hypothetical protein